MILDEKMVEEPHIMKWRNINMLNAKVKELLNQQVNK